MQLVCYSKFKSVSVVTQKKWVIRLRICHRVQFNLCSRETTSFKNVAVESCLTFGVVTFLWPIFPILSSRFLSWLLVSFDSRGMDTLQRQTNMNPFPLLDEHEIKITSSFKYLKVNRIMSMEKIWCALITNGSITHKQKTHTRVSKSIKVACLHNLHSADRAHLLDMN